MKYTTAIFAICAQLSLGSPVQKRQDIDFSAYKAIPTLADVAAPAGDPSPSPVTYDASAVATVAAAAATTAATIEPVTTDAAIKKRDACSLNAAGTGPAVTLPDDSASAFQSYSAFAAAATTVTTPVGYQKVLTNGLGSAQDATYMTYTMLSAYDPNACAEFCQAHQGCNTFNLFYERDPSVSPGPGCDNPASITYIKCSIFGGILTSASATNTGQWQDNFQVVIAGSNMYVATAPAAQPGFTGPLSFGNNAINAPSGYMGVQTFPQNQPYDPSVCAAACNAKSAFDVEHGLPSMQNPDVCEFFVAYILYENGNNGVFTCTYYTSSWDSSYATNNGQYDAQGNHYTIAHSYGYPKIAAPINGVPTQFKIQASYTTSSGRVSTSYLQDAVPSAVTGNPHFLQFVTKKQSGTSFALDYATGQLDLPKFSMYSEQSITDGYNIIYFQTADIASRYATTTFSINPDYTITVVNTQKSATYLQFCPGYTNPYLAVYPTDQGCPTITLTAVFG